MSTLNTFQSQNISSNNFSLIKPGQIVRVFQKIKEGDKTRVQIFEGIVITRKHGKGLNGTVTVRKIASGVGVERTFPIHSPNIEKIDVVKTSKIRRAKLYYIREKTTKETRRKTRIIAGEKTTQEVVDKTQNDAQTINDTKAVENTGATL